MVKIVQCQKVFRNKKSIQSLSRRAIPPPPTKFQKFKRLGAKVIPKTVLGTVLLSSFAHVIRYGGADLLTQLKFSGDDHVYSPGRTLVFTCFGATIGAYSTHMYSKFYPFVLKSLRLTRLGFVGHIGMEVGFHCCFLYYPLYYTAQEIVFAEKPSPTAVWNKLNANRATDLYNIMKVWWPFFVVNFSIVPIQMRAVCSGCYGIIWAMYLSHTRGSYKKTEAVETTKLAKGQLRVQT